MRLGILGSGQLGAMLAIAARRLGVETEVLAPDPGPAMALATRSRLAAWDDADAMTDFAARVDCVTYEVEHVPVEAAARLAECIDLCPSLAALTATGDRWRERLLLSELAIPHAEWVRVDRVEDARAVERAIGFPCLLKRRVSGYDGRGQMRVDAPTDLGAALAHVGGAAVAERIVPWRREVSLLVARGRDGAIEWYDPVENRHRGGILRVSRAPAPAIVAGDLALLRGWAERILGALDYVGVLTMELFDSRDGWLVNELAPRVHNSGHWTIEGAETSQFENHVRALVGWPLGSAAARGPAALVNVIGVVPRLEPLLRIPGASVHLYGKAARVGRKLGHVTVVGADDRQLAARLAAVCAQLVPAEESAIGRGP